MRILVDQSGYDLLNLGDVAMLQATVANLATLWPEASIAVICHDAEQLARYCPGTTPVPAALGRSGSAPRVLEQVRLGLGQMHKMIRPYTSVDHRRPRHDQPPRSLTAAVRWADVVVASGGGYITDTWWWHGFGVLSVLDLAQRMGKPTAMFGQGLGPLKNPLLRLQARRVLPRLYLLGLREGVTGLPLADALGVSAKRVVVTGDDGLLLAGSVATSTNVTEALGVNARVAKYAGVDGSVAALVGATLATAVGQRHAVVVGLPVSRYEEDSDLSSIHSLWPGQLPEGSVVRDLDSPVALATAAAGCRAVVTGSYHAAVFALAAGVPTVCLSNSPYYDAKFSGLTAMFPEASDVVPLTGKNLELRLQEAISRAWGLDEMSRDGARDLARTNGATSVGLYQRFANLVNADAAGRNAPSRSGVTC